MPYSGYHDKRNEFYKNRDLYYEYQARSPVFTAHPVGDTDALSIRDKFCPLHGGIAKFDMMVKNAYFYTCCGMAVPNEEMDIDVRDAGVTTIDGRSSRNPQYGRSSSGESGIIVPAGPSRSARNRKRQLAPDDAKLARHGYQIVNSQEKVSTSNMLQPSLSSSQIDNYRRNPVEDKYNRRIHGLGHI